LPYSNKSAHSHSGQQEDVMTKIASLEKLQFIHVLEGIKQGLKAQDQ
jgi:hypothetical protein